MAGFDFKTDYVLESSDVLLRPLKEGDHIHLLEYSLNEPELWKYSRKGAAGEKELKAYIQDALEGRKKCDQYPFIVFDKQNGKYAGSTRFCDIDLKNQRLQLGYTWYGKAFQGTGINKQCKYLLLEFAFERMNILRVEFRTNDKNERSLNAMKGIGCKVEGTLRSYSFWTEDERSNTVILSILAHEWHEEVRKMLKSKI